MATSITVRVQAKGGKFLADDIGGAEITIRDGHTGERLGGGLALGTDSGTIAGSYNPSNTSLSAIYTPADPPYTTSSSLQWLAVTSPTSGTTTPTSGLTVNLPKVTRPMLLAISALGPLGGLQSAHRAMLTQWIVPNQIISGNPGFIVELPGLLVQVLQPATHLAILSNNLPYNVPFQANVTMMCGCQINHHQPWVPGDFTVQAVISQVGSSDVIATVPLSFSGTASLFSNTWTLPAGSTGFYQAVITAVQASTGNIGTGTVTFFVKQS
ncbi:MAG TPA: hypothetical protein VF173_33705 [Thermoanaerobaculia bacterium]|nr:hypothetical protein [Thermoanaerobaculia bacterium]